MKTTVSCLLVLSCAVTPITAQDVGADGPYFVGWRDIDFRDANYNRGRIYGRIYYPAISEGQNATADPTHGPYPLTGFMHGWIEPASDYDKICTHLASWGFVVMSNDTETGALFVKMQRQAKDTRALMQWVEDESQLSSSWLAGMTNNLPWSAFGHSMGGAALSYLVQDEPRVDSLVMFEPYKGTLLGNTKNGFASFDNYPDSVLVIAGSQDLTNNWSSVVRPWYNQATSANRKTWALIDGGDHFGCTDPDVHALWGGGSLAYGSQHLAHRRLLTSFLQAEIKGEENYFQEIETSAHISFEASATDTPFWTMLDPNNSSVALLGSFAAPTSRLRVAGSFTTGSLSTIYGELGLDLSSLSILHDATLGASGWQSLNIPLDAAWTGRTIWFQALASRGNIGTFSRLTSIVVP
ncbi:MAG: alpha/beta hydrolase [Planctomycetota bacterium]|jgi:pimeloyl-ACP methyl ester carboxylesterase|nr:alpha/beta hydrolase [Planctomycetota bacterium]